MDDRRARVAGERAGLKVAGTVAILVRARLRGLIPTLRPLLDRLRATSFRMTTELYDFALARVGEGP